MWGKKSWKDMVRGWAWQGFGVAIIAVFAGYALFGANGVLAWGEYSQRLSAHRIELAKLEKERDILRHRVDLVNPQQADPDMADELIRKELGLARPDEVIIPLD
ncbi:MAG: septum formation initiator family protein [Sphingomonadales bacterium]|jgi:cell division protein FtsB|nr:septum formation initiator family protein [Sphingomonadales bacterium]